MTAVQELAWVLASLVEIMRGGMARASIWAIWHQGYQRHWLCLLICLMELQNAAPCDAGGGYC